MNFTGKASPLDKAGLEAATDFLDIDPARIWTVLSVETSGVGFLADKRPKILFERHVFSRLTGHKYDESHPGISNLQSGGYGPSGSYQYERLIEAASLDNDAALQSASWGIGQIMGFNYNAAGFASVAEMVSAMADSESAQLVAMAKFLKGRGLDTLLMKRDWAAFAKRYNGPDYSKNDYDKKLAAFYAKYSQGNLPDLDVRAAQLFLLYLGFDPGPVDGMIGNRTLAALNAFLKTQGKPQTSSVTSGILELLRNQAA